MAKKSRRVTRRRKHGGVQSLSDNQMMGVQAALSGKDTAVLLEPDTPVPAAVLAKMPGLHKTAMSSPEDRKVEMAPSQVRKAGRKTRRRKARRGGGLGESSATWPPDKSSFGSKIGSPENTDNLIGYGGKRRRSLKRK
uniref:Uncharacterized protein n=1 Tax=viral metagenome TaxID=1070528 RepID=A0A6C0CI76_9ZZZZ